MSTDDLSFIFGNRTYSEIVDNISRDIAAVRVLYTNVVDIYAAIMIVPVWMISVEVDV